MLLITETNADLSGKASLALYLGILALLVPDD